MSGVTIIGTGHFVPGEPVSNDALARVMDTNDEWIQTRTGIRQRHYAADGQGPSDLAVEASKLALEDAGVTPADIDYIIFATMTPEFFFPGSGPLLGAKLGIAGVPALDIRQQCAAMPYAFQLADGLVKSGAASTILLVGADAHAGFMPWIDWEVVRSNVERQVTPEAYERATKHRGLAVIFGWGFCLLQAGKPVLHCAYGQEGRRPLPGSAVTERRGAPGTGSFAHDARRQSMVQPRN